MLPPPKVIKTLASFGINEEIFAICPLPKTKLVGLYNSKFSIVIKFDAKLRNRRGLHRKFLLRITMIQFQNPFFTKGIIIFV